MKRCFIWAGKDPLAKLADLLGRGANINAIDHLGQTALVIAVNYRKNFLVKPLLDAGADANPGSPLTQAYARIRDLNDLSVVQDLLAAGAQNGAGLQTVFRLPTSPTKQALVAMLLAKHPDVDCRTAEGFTGLMQAAEYGNAAEVNTWIEAGACVDAQSLDGRTPLMFATASPAVTQLLLEVGANPNIVDSHGQTALLHAVCCPFRDLIVVEMLLKAGADRSVQDRKGLAAIDYAKEAEARLTMENEVAAEIPGCIARGDAPDRAAGRRK